MKFDEIVFDEQTNPGDDFFGYVNNIWIKQTKIPADKPSIGCFTILRDQSEDNIQAILEDKSFANEKFKKLYDSFMNEKNIENLGVKPLSPGIEKIISSNDKTQLASALGELEIYSSVAPFCASIDADCKSPDENIVYFGQGGLGLPDESYYKLDEYSKHRERYNEFIAEVFALLGKNGLLGVNSDFSEISRKIFAYETALAKFHRDSVALRDVEKSYNVYTFEDLAKLVSNFPLSEILKGNGFDLKTLDDVIVEQPEFFEALGKIWNETNLETLKFHAIFHYATSFTSYLSSDFYKLGFDFYSTFLNGVEQPRPRNKRGVGLVNGAMGEDIGKIYVERHFSEGDKKLVLELVHNLQNAYRQSIKDLNWMSEETKSKALVKLDKMTVKIGYPDIWKDFSKLDISDNSLFQNIVNVGKFETSRQIDKIGKPVDRSEWHMYPQMVNAYFNPLTNEIAFPAAILQKPFFDANSTLAQNYGGIGSVIGHEIGHCFDDQGSMFDEIGKMENWWTAADLKNFKEHTAKLVVQYDKFVPRILGANPDKKHVNGALTLGENIGDLGGVQIALKALFIALGDDEISGKDEIYRDFFVSYAITERNVQTIQLTELYLALDPHSPSEFRVNGIVPNVTEFYEAFDISPEHKLYLAPENRIKIW